MSEATAKIREILHGIASVGYSPAPFRVKAQLFDPPSYVVHEILVSHCGFHDVGPSEKVAWSCFVEFKGFTFEVRDWKRSTWTVEASAESAAAKEAGEELIRRIQSASKIADKAFQEEAKLALSKGRFFTKNVFRKLRSPYEFFRGQFSTHESTDDGLDEINRDLQTNRERHYFGQAAIGFYFSCLDHVETLSFPFVAPQMSFDEFKVLAWKDRFKTIFPVSAGGEIASIYQRLLKIKQDLRDELFHGYGGDERVLVSTRRGLVPMSFVHLQSSVHYDMPGWMPPIALANAFAEFEKLDAWLTNTAPFNGIMRIVESGLAVPFFGDRLETMRKLLGSVEDLDAWIEMELDRQVAFDNMEI